MLISVYVSKMARPLSKLAGNHNGRFAANDIIRFRLLKSRLHFGSFFLPEFKKHVIKHTYTFID